MSTTSADCARLARVFDSILAKDGPVSAGHIRLAAEVLKRAASQLEKSASPDRFIELLGSAKPLRKTHAPDPAVRPAVERLRSPEDAYAAATAGRDDQGRDHRRHHRDRLRPMLDE